MDNFIEFSSKISNNIKYFRKKNKLSQEELAEKIGTTQSNISDYEQGRKNNLKMLFEISKALDVSIEELLFFQTPNKSKKNFPISKFINRTYFGYYVNEKKVQSFELKIYKLINNYKAIAKIRFSSAGNWSEGIIELDNKFAIIKIGCFEKNKHFIISFNYYHDSNNDRYVGGLTLLQTIDSVANSPCMQICALSSNAIGSNKHRELIKFLDMQTYGLKTSWAVFNIEVPITLDKKYYNWLVENVNNLK